MQGSLDLSFVFVGPGCIAMRDRDLGDDNGVKIRKKGKRKKELKKKRQMVDSMSNLHKEYSSYWFIFNF